jgi:hypothetical protein
MAQLEDSMGPICKGGRRSDCLIARYRRRSSDCIGRSFSRVLDATQSLHRFEITVFKAIKSLHRLKYVVN